MDFKNVIWNENSYSEYIDYLKSISVNKTKTFNEKIFNDTKEVLGLKIPEMRKISKEILNGNSSEFLNIAKKYDKYLEEVMIESFVIADLKENIDDKIKRVDNFIPKISSWAICDSFVPSLKIIKKNKEVFWNYLMKKYNKSSKEFELRFIIICLMDYYIGDEHLDKIFEIFRDVKKEDYYVKMAVAWALCECFIKRRDKTLEFLKSIDNFDIFTFNKAIDKCRDSYRVTKEDKELLKNMKKAGR